MPALATTPLRAPDCVRGRGVTMGTVLASHWSGAAAQQPMRGRDVPELSCLVIWAGQSPAGCAAVQP